MSISVGSVSVDIIPNTQGIYPRLKAALVPAGDRAGQDAGQIAGQRFGAAMAQNVPNTIGAAIGRQIGTTIGQQIASAVSQALVDGIRVGGRQATAPAARTGDDTAGAFARAMKARLTEAFRSMPKLDINISDTGIDAELARIRAQIETLANKRIGIDINAADADAQIAAIEVELTSLSTYHPNIAVRADSAAALAQLAAVREEIASLSATPGVVRLETDGSFGAKLRASVAAAQASLPEINVTASTDDAQARVAALRAQMATLANARIGIDIDADTAIARIAAIRTALKEVAGGNASIDLRVDAARAETELAAVTAEADALTDEPHSLNIDADTGAAQGKLFALAIQLGILAGIQAGPIIAAGLGAIVASASAAAVGVGLLAAVAVPAISSIKNVLQLQTAAQQESTGATNSGANAAVAAQQKALQMASATQALASAERNGAKQITQAQAQVKTARQQAAQAAQQAAQQNVQAASQVATAEKDLSTAEANELQSQQDLIQARKDAAAQLQDLNNQLIDSQLSQQQGVFAVADAQAQLDADRATGAKVTAEQLGKDQLAYDQAVQSLKEQTLTTQRLQDQTTAANAAGVDGSKTVISAQQAVSQAQQDVLDKTQALAVAQQSADQQRVKGAQQVATAQAQIVTAQQAVVDAQQQAADSISSAQRQIQSAQLSTATSAATAESAQQKYQDALDKLSPSARGVLTSFLNLKSGFLAWSASLQPAVLPLFSRALDGIGGSLGKLSPLVLSAAGGVSTLEDRLGRELKTPFWVGLLADLKSSTGPAIVGLGAAIGNVFKGAAGIVDAFLPHIAGISADMDRITGRFAHFGTGLKIDPAFQSFLDYVKQTGPGLAQVLGKIFAALAQVSKAIAPVAGPVLMVVGAVAQFVGWLAKVNPGLLQAAYAISLLSTVFGILTAVLDANPLVLIGLGLVLLVDGLVEAYKHVGWFRDIVNTAWHAIAVVALWLWNDVFKPAFAGLVVAFQAVATAAVWLWQNVLVPAFNGIVLAGKILVAIIAVFVIAPIVIAFNLMASVATWLWQNALKPAFEGIATVALWLWHNAIQPAFNGIAVVAMWLYQNVISPYFGLVQVAFRAVATVATWLWKNALAPAFNAIGAVATWLWKNAIGPAFSGIATVGNWLWNNALRPAFELIKTGVGLVGQAFSLATSFIGKVWSQVEDIAKKPINFVIDMVYTHGIKAVWDKVADFVGLGHLPAAPKLLAAGGTVGAGFGPAVPMVTNRPTAIVGEGNPAYPEYVIPTDPKYRARATALHQAAGARLMAGGGILGGVEGFLDSAAKGVQSVGSAAWNGITDLGDIFLHPTSIWSKLSAPIRQLISGVGNFPFAREVGAIPVKMLTGIGAKLADFVTGGGSGGGGGIGRALGWAKSQAGKPYQWGGVGNPSWDCSGFMGGIESVLLGQNPDRRLFTTMAFQGSNAPAGWALNAGSPFRIGVTNAGVGHMAGTIGGVNVESQGDLGVLAGPQARGWNDGLFTEHYGYVGKYDGGGYLPPGLSTVFNDTGRPEPVLTGAQWDKLTAATAGKGGAPDQRQYQITLQGSQMTAAEQASDLVRHMAFLG